MIAGVDSVHCAKEIGSRGPMTWVDGMRTSSVVRRQTRRSRPSMPSTSVSGRKGLTCKDKENNWLPAPKGTFSLYIRAYWPEYEDLDGTWTPPAVEKVK